MGPIPQFLFSLNQLASISPNGLSCSICCFFRFFNGKLQKNSDSPPKGAWGAPPPLNTPEGEFGVFGADWGSGAAVVVTSPQPWKSSVAKEVQAALALGHPDGLSRELGNEDETCLAQQIWQFVSECRARRRGMYLDLLFHYEGVSEKNSDLLFADCTNEFKGYYSDNDYHRSYDDFMYILKGGAPRRR